MVADRPEDTGSLPDSSRPKREPPTIDLEATEVSSETRSTADASPADTSSAPPSSASSPEPAPESPTTSPIDAPVARPVSPWIVAPVSGAAAAALVIGVGWMLGWPPVQPASAPATSQLSATIDTLSARVAGLEPKVGKPVPDPAAAARTDALEKTVAVLRAELAATRAQGEKLASALNEVKSAPPADGTASPDLSGIDARIAKIESQMRTQGAEIAQQGNKLADTKPADDLALRRLVAGALLDVLVRTGDAYPAALGTTKALAPNPDDLKPLDQFAEKGVPSPARLSSELLALMPKLQPAAQQNNATTGTGIVERLQAGAAKLVKIERTDTGGTDRGAVIARITAAALRNDFSEARRQLMTLEPDDRAAAQAWLARADARDAALAASRKFAADAMAALAKPAN
jgi:hypothetical protein